MKQFRKSALLAVAIASLAGCLNAASNKDPAIPSDTRVSLDVPAAQGTRALVFTGDSLTTRSVAINGLAVDTSSVEAVSASVAKIFASDYPNGTVIAESAATSPDFAVDYTVAGRETPGVYYGVNVQIASKRFLAMPLYRELVRHLKIDIARFPGGQERVKYERNAAETASWDLGATSAYQYLLTGKDVENFIALCRDLGIKAEPEINVTNDDAAMWAGLADQIVNGLGYPLEYVSVGNEPDINPTRNWAHFGAKKRDDAIDAYAARYERYRAAIRAVKADVRFVLGELSCNREPDLSSVLDRMLAATASCPPEAVSAHWYLLGDYGQTSSNPDYPSIAHLSIAGNSGENARRLSAIAATLAARSSARAAGAKIFIGEWGPSWSATADGADALDTLAAALWGAEVLEYGKAVGVDCMEYFGLSDPASFAPWNSAMIAIDGSAAAVRPQYYVRMMHEYAWGNREISVANAQNEDFSVYASKSDAANYLMLLNRTDGSIERTIRMTTASGTKTYDVLMIPRSMAIVTLP